MWPPDWSELTPSARVRAVAEAITRGPIATRRDLRGLEPEILEVIAQDQTAPLGDAYRSFLSLMGGGAGRFLRGSDVYHPDVLGLGDSGRELLVENGSSFMLEETDRVFFMHQGYQFAFLRGVGPDPEVWFFTEVREGCEGPAVIAPRFTDWLRRTAESEAATWDRLVRRSRARRWRWGNFYRRHNLDGNIMEDF